MKKLLFAVVTFTCLFTAFSCSKSEDEEDNDIPIIQSIKLSESQISINIGKKTILTVSSEPASPWNYYEWISSNEKIASVYKGEITAHSAGECTITVTTTNAKGVDLYDECIVKVNPIKVTDIRLSHTEKTIELGQTFELIADLIPYNSTDKTILWNSSNTNIATVEDGKVTAFQQGECVITAMTQDGKIKAECKLIVVPVSVKSIKLSNLNMRLLDGETAVLKYSILPENAENKNVTWQSSSSDVVSVDNNGNISALKIGSSTITVTTEDGNHTSSCEVIVSDIAGFMQLTFSGSVAVINGYVTGNVYCLIKNTSSKKVTLTKLEIKDSSNNRVISSTTDPSLLGVLSSGEEKNLGGRISQVYYPIFTWTFNCDGKEYEVSKIYE